MNWPFLKRQSTTQRRAAFLLLLFTSSIHRRPPRQMYMINNLPRSPARSISCQYRKSCHAVWGTVHDYAPFNGNNSLEHGPQFNIRSGKETEASFCYKAQNTHTVAWLDK